MDQWRRQQIEGMRDMTPAEKHARAIRQALGAMNAPPAYGPEAGNACHFAPEPVAEPAPLTRWQRLLKWIRERA